jgi:hypothetical protein
MRESACHRYHKVCCCEVNVKLMVVKHAKTKKHQLLCSTDIQHYPSKCLTQEETERITEIWQLHMKNILRAGTRMIVRRRT